MSFPVKRGGMGGAHRNRGPAAASSTLDLVLLALLVVLAVVVTVASPTRWPAVLLVVGVPFTLFAPGYALVAALYPERPSALSRDGAESSVGVRGFERLVFSIAVSLVVSPLVALFLNSADIGVRLVTVVPGVGLVTLVALAVAAVRRLSLPPAERFTVPVPAPLSAVSPNDGFGSRTDLVLRVVVVVSVLVTVASVAYALGGSRQGETFTELYVLPSSNDGGQVAGQYPGTLVEGRPTSLVVGVENHEGQPETYTLVVVLQRLRGAGNRTHVVASSRLATVSATVAPNGTWRRRQQVTPTVTGDRLRLAFLLYRGDPPSQPSLATAYREVHVWVSVRNASTATAAVGRFDRVGSRSSGTAVPGRLGRVATVGGAVAT